MLPAAGLERQARRWQHIDLSLYPSLHTATPLLMPVESRPGIPHRLIREGAGGASALNFLPDVEGRSVQVAGQIGTQVIYLAHDVPS